MTTTAPARRLALYFLAPLVVAVAALIASVAILGIGNWGWLGILFALISGYCFASWELLSRGVPGEGDVL